MKLQEQLDEKKNDFESTAPEYVKTIYADGIKAAGATLKGAKTVSDKAPNFTLKNATGENVSLQDYLENGPVILTWYRGGWCPYCNLTLKYLQNSLPDFSNAGASLLALTPELPDNSISTKEKNNLDFEVLSDVGNKVAKEYGIVFKLIEPVAEKYENSFGMTKHNGDDSFELPLAATYVIDGSGTIQYAFLDSEYRNRAEPSDILEVLEKLKK